MVSAPVRARAGRPRSGRAPRRCARWSPARSSMPGPLLDQQAAAGAVGLEVDRRGDAVADEDRQGEVAELPFRGRDIGLEAVVVVEEEREAPALDDQRVEGREDVDAVGLGQGLGERLGGRPVRLGAVDRDGDEPAAADAGLDQRGHRLLARGVHVADRVEADDALRAQGAVEQVVEGLRLGGGARARRPAEVAVGELVGLHHAVAGADGQHAGEEGVLERALLGLAAGPGVVLVDELVVVDVADGQRAVAADAGDDAAEVGGRDVAEPGRGGCAVALHVGEEEADSRGSGCRRARAPSIRRPTSRPRARRRGRRGRRRGCATRGCGGASAR